jgi:hydroxypyruvate isomerase
MPRFAANISTLYPEYALVDRIAAAARDGFAAVEVQSPYAVASADLHYALRGARMQLVLMNAPQGDLEAGERGLAALPGRERDFEESLDQALDYARLLAAPRIHVMAGKPAAGAVAEAESVFLRNIALACTRFAPHGIAVTIEPINTRDMPGYFLTQPEQAAPLIERVAAANLELQFDCYHAQIMGGDLVTRLRKHFAHIGHVQIAGVPDRNEPDTGEINYSALFGLLDGLSYRGWVGCEYRPARGAAAGGTSAGLGWMRRL